MLSRLLLSLALYLSSMHCVFAADDTVHAYRLPNGLQLFVKPDHRAPVAILQIWYKVGSSYEHGGITGISHALEHMMFRGAQKYGPGELLRIVAENGGEQNAFTSYDFTGYYVTFSTDKLPLGFALEADRMRGLLLREQDFAQEINIVKEERRLRTDDNPQAQTTERFNAAAYINSPYHHAPIGWMTDLDNMSINDLRQWYNSWYGPNNALIVVMGDVDPDQVYKLAQQYFGPLKSITLPILKPQIEIEPLGKRTVVVKAPAKLPWLIMGYNVPSLKTAKDKSEAYALEVLAAILSSGDSSRLPEQLVRQQQIASDAGTDYSLYQRMSGLFLLAATPAAGHTTEQLEQALLSQVQALQNTLVSTDELARVKAQVTAGKIYQKDSLTEQASEIGSLEAVGLSWRDGDAYVSRVNAITPEQLRAVARKYLIADHLTVTVLQPLPLTKETNINPVPAGDLSHVH